MYSCVCGYVESSIYGSMQLNAGDLISEKFMLDANIVDMVVGNFAKYSAHMSNYSVLSAIVDGIIPDNMRPNLFFAPANLKPTKNRFHLVLITGFLMLSCAEIVPCGGFLANAYGTAFGIVNHVVFNDPSLTPVNPQ